MKKILFKLIYRKTFGSGEYLKYKFYDSNYVWLTINKPNLK